MAPHRLAVPSLRRSLVLSAIAVVGIATIAMIVALSTILTLSRTIDSDTNVLIVEQRSADDIVALTYQQQLDAYRFLQQPEPARRASFRALGDEADVKMRQYLFHDLSPAARLQVERMKETHETFEVLAQRAFDLADRGEMAAARTRLAALDSEAAKLDVAVDTFLQARVAQRTALVERYRALTSRVRLGLALVAIVLLALAAALGRQLRRSVVRPLEQLTSAAHRIRGGDPLARVPSQHYEELQHVAAAFNEMADSVQEARETVEMQNEELRQSLEQLQETQEELVQQEKLSAMGQMLAGLAHELNNPLGGLLGMAELLRAELAASSDARLQRMSQELAAPLEREAVRARDLVRSLLSFSRKGTGTVEPTALHAAISTAVALRAHAFVQAGRQLHMEVPAAIYVMADAQKLQHAVVNVVNNALDAIVSSGGSELRITASALDGETVRVNFEDDGGGFRDVDAAFTPFYTTKPADRGTGLGLTLVRQFVEECGGTVAAANRPEGGARLTMLLRRAESPAADERIVAPAADTGAERAPGPERAVADPRRSGAPTPARVLVVDDEPSLREVQRRLLMLEGFEVLVAASGDEARHILAREHVDLVVSDLQMPGRMDGQALLTVLAREHPDLAARALLVTGDVTGGVSARLPVPPDRVIRKPFTRAEYVARVREALRRDAG